MTGLLEPDEVLSRDASAEFPELVVRQLCGLASTLYACSDQLSGSETDPLLKLLVCECETHALRFSIT